MLIFLTLRIPATDTWRFVWDVVMPLLHGVATTLAGLYSNALIAAWIDGAGHAAVFARLSLSGLLIVGFYLLATYFMGLKGLYADFRSRLRRTSQA